MSQYLTSKITPAGIDAVNALATTDPGSLAVLTSAVRSQSKVQAGDRVPAEDVASVAVIIGAALLECGRASSPGEAAALAVRTAVIAALQDTAQDAEHVGGSLDDTDDDGQPRLRLASPYAPDPAAPYRTTTRDLFLSALSALPDVGDDIPGGVVAHALLDGEWKGGKVPAAAVRRALDLPPVTGRAGTAWTAEVTGWAADLLPDLHDTYRSALNVAHGKARRVTDDAARQDHRDAVERPARDGAPMRRDSTSPGSGQHSGPASLAVVVRFVDCGPMIGQALHATGTAVSRPLVTRESTALASSLPTSLPAYSRDAAASRRERDLLAFDGEALSGPTGARIPGVSVDRDGVAVAGSGQRQGAGSGSGKAATRPAASRKAGKGGGTGPTIPCGPRR